MLNIILLGPPGRGQGHPGQRGCRRSAAWSSCRPATCCAQRVAAGTPIGLKAKAVMDAGELVTDAIVTALIGERLDSSAPTAARSSTAIPRTAAPGRGARSAARRARPHARSCDRARGRRGRAGRAHHRPLHLRQVRRAAITTASSRPKVDGHLRRLRLDRVQAPARRQ